jgi:hypothetical protein
MTGREKENPFTLLKQSTQTNMDPARKKCHQIRGLEHTSARGAAHCNLLQHVASLMYSLKKDYIKIKLRGSF